MNVLLHKSHCIRYGSCGSSAVGAADGGFGAAAAAAAFVLIGVTTVAVAVAAGRLRGTIFGFLFGAAAAPPTVLVDLANLLNTSMETCV